jgi:hypothetical protein
MGDTEQASERIKQVIDQARTETRIVQLANALYLRSMILIRQGHWEEAELILAEIVSLAHTMPYPHAEGHALLSWAHVHLQEGESEQALVRLKDALTIFRRLGAEKDIEQVEQVLAQIAVGT